jgi:parallel beta-helix repeat protein
MSDNLYNFGVWGNYPDYFNDIDDSNIINGKPIYYWVNERDTAIPTDAGYVAVINSTNITVRDLDLTRNGEGSIIFHHTTSSIIENVTVSKTLGAISLRFSDGNTIRGNLLEDNGNYGIELFASDNNVITDNTILNNSEREGILLWGSRYNTIARNTLKNNHCGASVEFYSDGNEIYHNNFMNNAHQIAASEGNAWDNGWEGNYWSDYNGIDLGGDGVGDTRLPWQNVDYYPLMNPYWNPCDINHDLKVDLKDVYKMVPAYGSYPGHPKWSPNCDINNDDKIDLKDYYTTCKNYGKSW